MTFIDRWIFTAFGKVLLLRLFRNLSIGFGIAFVVGLLCLTGYGIGVVKANTLLVSPWKLWWISIGCFYGCVGCVLCFRLVLGWRSSRRLTRVETDGVRANEAVL